MFKISSDEAAAILVLWSPQRCSVKPQKPPCYRAGVATAQAETGSGTEAGSDESVPELEEQDPTQAATQAQLAAVAEIHENQPAKQNRGKVKRRHGRLCPKGVFDRL